MKPATNHIVDKERVSVVGRENFRSGCDSGVAESSAQAASPTGHTFTADFKLVSLAGIHNPLASI